MRHSSSLVVNLTFLVENLAMIQELAPKAKILPMVKGNAYGHGIHKISRFLVEECGIKRLGVASLGEALEIIQEIPAFTDEKKGLEIVVFSDTEIQCNEARQHYVKGAMSGRLFPVCGTARDLETFLEVFPRKMSPMIKINTGMNRMGLRPDEINRFLAPLQKRGVKHLLQHFSSSWEMLQPGDATDTQYNVFKEVKEMLLSSGVRVDETSVANSGAIEQGIGVDETYVRPGLMLYGPPSVTEPKILWNGHQISSFTTKVVHTFIAKEGDCVGYGHNKVTGDCLIALLPIGYADGFLRYYTGLPLTINGFEGVVHGFVNMDMTAVAFYGDVPERLAKLITAEDPVTIWTHNNHDINAKAVFLKTNSYQLMTAISVRIPRKYTSPPPLMGGADDL